LERRLSRDVPQDARDYAHALMQTEAYRVSRVARKKIDTLFGEAKQILSLVRLRLRGLSGARDEFLLTATVQNLKRLAVHATRPLPQPVTA
jgi:Transposase DDE domain